MDDTETTPVLDDLEHQEAVAATLVANHREFLAFVERRVGDRAVAEDILQEAFVRSVEHVDLSRGDDAVIAWFYRVLRNAVTDRHRRTGARDRALERFAAELSTEPQQDDEVRNAICQCVTSIATTLKPNYASALTRISVEGASLAEFAREEGITENNAAVRVHRARAALRERVKRSCGSCADHGCLDCSCGGPATPR